MSRSSIGAHRPAQTFAFVMVVALITMSMACATKRGTSEWVHPGANGTLVYKTTPAGDRIIDFSHAGYMGGGVALPDVPTRRTVLPSGGADDTANIQAAIDEVAKLPAENGIRGAVLLAPGEFTCGGSINIATSGVVLRGSGSGSGKEGTTIRMLGPRHAAIVIGRPRQQPAGGREPNEEDSAATARATPTATAGATVPAAAARDERSEGATSIADAYVPAGATTFHVADPRSLSVGDTIQIRRPTTPAWVHLMNMDTLVRDGRPQTWIATSRRGITQRTITAIEGNALTIDVPLADSYDSRYLDPPGAAVAKVQPPPRVTQVGVEHLHIQCPPLEIDYGHAPYSAIRVGGDDCWARDVYCEETMNATVLAGRRITMQNVRVTHTYPNLGASKPSDFSIEGSQILIDRCKITGDNEYFVWTSSLQPGPNVVLNSTFRGRGSRIQPHQRWSTGLLVDNCTVPDGGIDFMNRGVAGSGHGWTMGWAVAWNCIAKTYVIQNPPGAANWAIGCVGERQQTARLFDTAPILPDGLFESHGKPIAPQSLYLAQLAERLGPSALERIGYRSDSTGEFPDKSTPRLKEWPREVDPQLGPDLASHRPMNASNVREGKREFGAEKAVDNDDTTYWATDDDARRMTLEIDMEGPVDVNALKLGEALGLGSRVREYEVHGQVDSDWTLLSRGTTISDEQIDRFARVTVWKVRLTILKSDGYPAIRKFGLYLAK